MMRSQKLAPGILLEPPRAAGKNLVASRPSCPLPRRKESIARGWLRLPLVQETHNVFRTEASRRFKFAIALAEQ